MAVARTLQRYAVPGFLVSGYQYFKAGALISPSARVQLSSRVTFGKGTVVKAFAVIQSSGGRVQIGRDCAVSSFDHISTGAGDVILGDHVRIAPNCTIVGGTKEIHRRDVLIVEQPEADPKGVVIEDDVLIGAASVILPGARVGRGAVIGAGSVVQGDVPEYAIVAGTPAKVIGHRE
jgi:acetyltransferase-like isoleucine patch superfamily enzyme